MRSERRLIFLLAALTLAGAGGFPAAVHAGIEIKLPLPPLPPLPPLLFPKLPDPRDLIPIPNLKAFFVPDIDVDIVFEDGYWWTPRNGEWHRSRDYRGPYVLVPRAKVPPPLVRLPPRFREEYHKEKRIPYGQWKKMHGGGHGRDRDADWERDDDRGRGRGHGGDDDQGGGYKGKGKGHGKNR